MKVGNITVVFSRLCRVRWKTMRYIFVPFQSLEALECNVDVVCPNKKMDDKYPKDVYDFEGDQIYSEKSSHEFELTTNFNVIDAATYDALVIPGGRAP